MRKKELHIYLYEPIPMHVDDHQGKSYHGEFPNHIPVNLIKSEYLDSIKIFIDNNKLSNVKIFTCDYNIHRLQKQYNNLDLYCFDTFLVGVNYQAKFDRYENDITKKFWCANWKYTAHRHIVTSYLISLSGNYSWNLKCNYETLKKNSWFDLEKLSQQYPKIFNQLKKGIDILENNVFSIDHNIPALDVEEFDGWYSPTSFTPSISDQFLKSYKECFCAIVNESNYARPLGYFSEKTLLAINAGLPFLLVAPPNTLEYIKTFGFKTFDQWWDESYDQEEDHEKRMLMIFQNIDYINSKSLEELKFIYKEMKEILEFNKNHIRTILEKRNGL
jgi:hypothetical protein